MENNRFQVTRDLKREFYLLFKKNNIQIPYPQVTVNPQDEKEREKASPEQIYLAMREQKKLRGIEITDEPSKPKSKRSRIKKQIKDSLEKASEDLED